MAKVSGGDSRGGFDANAKLFRDLQLGFVRIHILHHASVSPIYGSGISAELETHGYRLSWGTLYPLLHSLEGTGFLVREERVVDGKVRKYYRITPLGKRALDEARRMALELVNEISQSDHAHEPKLERSRSPRR
jgi:PadR family transcriptional regulator PadR